MTVRPAGVPAAVRGTYAAFIACGFSIASWASRIPQVRDHLHLTPSALGLVLLSIGVGSLVSLPLAGVIVHHLGSRWTVTSMAVLQGLAIAGVALGYLAGVVPVVAGLFVFGLSNGAWDPAMNVQGAAVERALGRSIMSRFHAGFSAGTVAGALVGVGMVALHVPVTLHLMLVALVTAVAVPIGARYFLPEPDESESSSGEQNGSLTGGAFLRWLEPRTLLVGIFVLAFAFTEGAGNDWTAVALIDGYHAPAALGTLALALFLAGMTGGRWFGAGLLDRYGRVRTVRTLAVLALAGLLLFVFGRVAALALAGALLWGAGASLGFPTGMSAAADDAAAAAGRVSVVASIAYCGFLLGPPSIGFLGNRFTVLHALTAVPALLLVAVIVAGALRPPR